MNAFRRPIVGLVRGLCAAIVCGVAGALVCVVFAFVAEVPAREIVFPLAGCSAVCAGAGWATFFPTARSRFAVSLGSVFLGSVLLWLLLPSMKLTPQRLKADHHPLLYTSEFWVLVAPPLGVAAVLSVVQAITAKQS